MTKNRIVQALSIICFLSHSLVANLTTLQFWDPSPYYAANNNLMPANNQIVQLKKAQQKNLRPDKSYHIALNLSGLVQASCRARSCGCGDYGTVCGDPSKGFEMGDFRGTINALGLLLGNSPNGNNIWANGIDNGDVENLTPNSINATQLPPCLQNIAKMLSGNFDPTTWIPTATGASNTNPDLALMFDPQTDTDVFPSMLTSSELANDTTFFGAFSLPLKYNKNGFRFEIGAEFGDNIALTIQSGVSNIKQTTTGLISISDCCPIVPGCTTVTTSTSGNTINPGAPQYGTCLYNELNFRNPNPPTTNSTAQADLLYNQQISLNADEIFGPCGINQSLCNFDEYSIEDIRAILTIKNSYDIDRYTRNQSEGEEWPDMIFTPYVWVGGSVPIAKKKDYSKLLSLPFGNNGHASLGGAFGMTFDFTQFVEIGVEAGIVHFFAQNEYRPVPTSPLQRVVYPFWSKVKVEPGANWHFKAMLNAYQFMHHISFWATYELIEHQKDCFSICNNPTAYRKDPVTNKTFEEPVFLPKQLSCCSDWRAQFINLALVFDIQPGIQMSFLLQQSISPKNAYYPTSLLGTVTFLF